MGQGQKRETKLKKSVGWPDGWMKNIFESASGKIPRQNVIAIGTGIIA
jgi:hypothetical protein